MRLNKNRFEIIFMNQPIRLAVVDDHELFRKGFVSLLKEHNDLKVVIEAANGKELIEQLKSIKVDVILLDIEMPVMDGIETTERLQGKYDATKIIVVSMYNDSNYIKHLISKGAHGFIHKEHGVEIVVEAIYGVLENNYYFNEEVSQSLVKGLMKNKLILPNFEEVSLTEREKEIIYFISKELTNKEIGERLNLSTRTIDGHKERILQKTKAKNSVGIIMYAVNHQII